MTMLLQLPSSSRVHSLLPSTTEGASAGAELVTSDGRALPLLGALLRGEAQGGIARLVLEQTYKNSYAENLRVTYRMPLPADGAVSGYEFQIGERVVVGVVDRKARARERFETAIASGKTAALLEQERADIFTQQIGNIPPGETVIARITIDQRLVWLPEGEWELRFPTVIGPRYIGSADTAADIRATHIKVTDQPLPARFQIAIAIKDAITGGGKPSSPTHQLAQTSEGMTELSSPSAGVNPASSNSGGASLDRDVVMRWPVAAPSPGISLATASAQQGTYALLTIVPPSPKAKPRAVPRDLLVLLDTSGSMSGGPLEKAKQVVALMLDSLDENDRFELIEFSNSPRHYHQEPLTATAQAKQAAIRWVRSRVADGGTEMRAAVIESMQSLRIGAQRQIIVVTDGYVGGEHQILEALNRRLPKSCRLHVLGVGSAVNRSLATALARAGRGVEVIVGIDEDAERGAKRMLDRTKTPLLTNVEITGSAVLRHAPERIPDVFERAPLVAALAIRPEGGQLVVRGQLGNDDWEQTLEVAPVHRGSGNGAIVALYGRERVADVEANAVFSSVDGEIEELGMTFQIATRMTSWVAIDESRRVTGPTRDELVPQELPYGTTASAFGLRGALSRVTGRMAVATVTESLAEEIDGAVLGGRAQFDMDESMDIGESAPSEIFADENMEPPGSYAPPPRSAAYVMPPARSRMAPPSPPPAQAEYKKNLSFSDDEFEGEEPTGKEFEPLAPAQAIVAKPAPAPAKELARAPEPEDKPRALEQAEKTRADEPERRASLKVGAAPRVAPSSSYPQANQPSSVQQAPLQIGPERPKKASWIMIGFALGILAALIVLLLWWLLA